jgi:hypothetical protein
MMTDDGLLRRVARDTAVAVVVMAGALYGWRPAEPRLALGVVGGGVLMAAAWWAIGGLVNQAVRSGQSGENRRISGGFQLVKFFTRHAILAFAAYGMMARLQLHPVGLLMGVSAVLVGATMEAARGRLQVPSSKFKVRDQVKSEEK